MANYFIPIRAKTDRRCSQTGRRQYIIGSGHLNRLSRPRPKAGWSGAFVLIPGKLPAISLSHISAREPYAGAVIASAATTAFQASAPLALVHPALPTGLMPSWLDPSAILGSPGLGPWVVLIACAFIFAETGLLIGFFLPGDSLLFTAGLLVATGTIGFNVWLLVALLAVSAFLGNQVGYAIGAKAGPALFRRPDSRLFRRSHVESAHAFFERHGGRALILARFVPVVRTFVPVVVGIAEMDRRRFILFNALGAVSWTAGITLLGFVLGDRVPFIKQNLDLIFVAIVLISVLPILISLVRKVVARRP